jgi:hypothetical protein
MINYRELKEFCNSLEEKQLEENVALWQEEGLISDISVMKLEEDHYICPDSGEDGCYPLSEASEPIESLKKVYSVGYPVLCENF